MPWNWTKRAARSINERRVTLSFWTVVVVSAIIVSVLAYQLNQVRVLSEDTRDLGRANLARIKESNSVRVDLVSAFRRSNQSLCVEIEKLKQGFRIQAFENYNNLPKTAKLLNLELTPELRQAALESRNKQLNKYKAKPGGCPLVPKPVKP